MLNSGEDMKRRSKIIIGVIVTVIISITLQTLVLMFIQKYYIDSELDITLQNVTDESVNTSIDDNKDQGIDIPEEAQNVSVSSNGRYILYIYDNKAHVVDYDTKDDSAIDFELRGDNTLLTWHDTEPKVIISSVGEDDLIGFKMYIYEAKTKEVNAALDYNNEQRRYYLNNIYERITDIAINNYNTILYLKVQNKFENWINRLDISGDTYELPLDCNNIGNYVVLKEKDELCYENLDDNCIYYTDSGIIKKISIDNNLKIIGMKNDVLYIAKEEDNKISKIYYKNIDNEDIDSDNWCAIDIREDVDSNNIILSKAGGIYIAEGNKLKNLIDNSEINYEGGKVIKILEDEFFIRKGKKIKKISLK